METVNLRPIDILFGEYLKDKENENSMIGKLARDVRDGAKQPNWRDVLDPTSVFMNVLSPPSSRHITSDKLY